MSEQIERAQRIQDKILQRFETLLDSGEINATELATCVRLMMANGWTFDPTRLPQKLQDKLTSLVDPSEFEDDSVLPITRKTGS